MHCDECGGLLGWAGMSWARHSNEMHRVMRRRLYQVIWTQLGREVWRRATGE